MRRKVWDWFMKQFEIDWSMDERVEKELSLISHMPYKFKGSIHFDAPGAEAFDPTSWCCHRCVDEKNLDFMERMTVGMIVCPDCGNKRCPKASDHRLDCTGSNKTGQAGSVY